MTLSVDIELKLGDFTLATRFESGGANAGGAGGVTALFGESGVGKTSIVNAIAGLLRPDAGRIALDGAVLFDAAARVFVPAERRRFGYVFQEGRLFPHLSVRRNLLFARWFDKADHAPDEFAHVVELLGLEPLLERRPALLSGGEKQRVAIGRALLARPRLLLLDEPLASLDAARKEEILSYLVRLRDELSIPMIYVSHSVEEVTRLASNVVVIADGRVTAVGPVGQVLPQKAPDYNAVSQSVESQ